MEAVQSYTPSGLHVDGLAIFGSLVLFAALLVSGFGRISGLNAWVDGWVARQREKRRERVADERLSLERRWQDDEDTGASR